jgi:hypothetical protein
MLDMTIAVAKLERGSDYVHPILGVARHDLCSSAEQQVARSCRRVTRYR